VVSVLLPILARRHTKHPPESSGERLVRIIAGIESDLDHRPLGTGQPKSGTFQPQSAHMLLDRLAHHSPENPVKMVRREAGHLGQLFQREGLIEMILEVDHHPQQPLSIVDLGIASHPVVSSLAIVRIVRRIA